MAPSHIIISPGPCSPSEAGISTDVVRRLGATIPILGVCLGHQCIGAAYGGEIVRAGRPMHGKTSMIHHRDRGIFRGLPNPFRATRYHSLVIAPASVPAELEVTATSEDGEIMAVQHRRASGARRAVPSRVGADRARLPPGRHFLHGVPASPRALPLAADGALVPGRPGARHAGVAIRPRWTWCGDHRVHRDVDGPGRRDQLRARWASSGARRRIVLKPFLETTTFRNVRETRVAVVNLTDDAMLFAQGAISSPQFPWAPAAVVRGAVLEAACSWRELEVVTIDDTPPRSRIEARVVHRGTRREFLGFNRARHAVLEAAILATRTHLLPAEEIRAAFARLQVIVDKTAGPREQEAMAMLTEYVRSRA